MKRFKSKQIQATPEAELLEKNSKFNADEEFKLLELLSKDLRLKENIINCVKSLFLKYNFNYDQQFRLLEHVEEFSKAFKDLDLNLNKPVFVICALSEMQWILLFITIYNTKTVVFFKDPSGSLVSFRLQNAINEKFPDVEFVAHTGQETEPKNVAIYGSLSVRNLKICLNLYQTNSLQFLRNFQNQEFSRPDEVYQDRFTLIVKDTKELAKNNKFKTAFKNFVKDLPIDLNEGRLEYKKVIDEERNKSVKDREKIKAAKDAYLAKVKAFKENNKNYFKKDLEENQITDGVLTLEIEKKFPNEMTKITQIFDILEEIVINDKLYAVLRNMCEILDIDYEKLKFLYELKSKKDNSKPEEESQLVPEKIDDLLERHFIDSAESKDATTLDQLLEEATLGKDEDQRQEEEISKLRSKYNLVKAEFEKIKDKNVIYIKEWATAKKGYLKDNDDDICKAIAMTDLALNLWKGGWRLRDPQILAILIFLYHNKNQGRLCQVQTGEGKTLIVAILAIVKVLQGHTVDVITSNEVLAADGLAENKLFYSIFNLTGGTNNILDGKKGYKADILYGTISNFQFDFLKESFEGYQIRKGRKFGIVILDEVDSMLVDNGGHIAKISTPYPGMESLRYIYIKIWQELHKAEEKLLEESKQEVGKIVQKCIKENDNKHLENYIENLCKNERKNLVEKIEKEKLFDEDLVPKHLITYVNRKLTLWIKNAIYAKYGCHEHQQYRIITDKNGEDVITPVDYMNTGVTMKNTVWSNGLHQFVQIKHNLRLTFESMTSSFISNIGYIKKYQDWNIFGMTGTLGSRAEQDLLSHIYNVSFAKIPTYKPKKFEETPPIVVEDEDWSITISLNALGKIEEDRAVLIICETEKDVRDVEQNLKISVNKLKVSSKQVRIRKYANEDDVNTTKDKVKIGDIILATNIAGRGTNFKTNKDLEKNGGLHVCVGFLPYNKRVEDQAFGRTSRQGNKGTAELFIRQSEVQELGLDKEATFEKIKTERDQLERQRLDKIDKVLIKEIDFKDKLFEKFSKFQFQWKVEHQEQEDVFFLKDLRESWAFWLDKKNFKAENITKSVDEEFQNFLNQARLGQISHNPFYCINQAEYFLDIEEFDKAFNQLSRALELNGNRYMAGAHLKLFETEMLRSSTVWDLIRKAVKSVISLPSGSLNNNKLQALEHLKQAKKIISKEVDYIETNLVVSNSSFEKILIPSDSNLFLKHIYSKLYLLKVHFDNIERLIETFENNVELSEKILSNDNSFDDIKANTTFYEIDELQLSGVDSFYSLKILRQVSNELVALACSQIAGGIAIWAIGVAFPPFYPFGQGIGISLITEGIIDLILEMLTETDFDISEYLKDKAISYGVDIITFGISKLLKITTIIKGIIKVWRTASSFLKKSKFFKKICTTAAKKIDDLIEAKKFFIEFKKLTKEERLAKLNNFSQTDQKAFKALGGSQKLKKLQLLHNLGKLKGFKKLNYQLFKSVSKSLGSKLLESFTEKVIIPQLFNLAIEDYRKKLKQELEDDIKKDKILCDAIKSTPIKKIKEVVEDYVQTTYAEKFFENLGEKIVSLGNKNFAEVIILIYKVSKNSSNFVKLKREFRGYLNDNLPGGKATNILDFTLDSVCDPVVKKLLEYLLNMIQSGFKLGKGLFKRYAVPRIKNKFNELRGSKPPPDDLVEDYKILGLQLDDATDADEAKNQYNFLTLKMQPNRNIDNPDAVENLNKLHNAYTRVFNHLTEVEEQKTNPVIIEKPDGEQN